MSQSNGKIRFPPSAVASDVGRFAHDVVTLAELQAELLRVETQECARSITGPLIALVVAVVLMLGCVPIALTAVAFGLVQAGFANWSAFLTAAVIGLAIAGITAAGGWLSLRATCTAFARSKQEFQNNIGWLKRVLKGKATRSTTSA